ncbi:alpha/beta fold hydrolase [Halarcobacter ebronensis]|uniref:AB hydrolase-1 domain-containing protein n=1 Tax=Halarcobacter ebronensis TaxID=1462615 RepID=A0A4Q1AR74_9BACT|nr:alpha/beta hydrolase [Halarcobacter ebronensis]QKF82342.1 alpha/beta hydrolase family protein [Halarcobacter ebronensis]RXK07629.1 hypothetical protein CRV07_03980 [Halarcobacter ebronensis]
MKKEKIYLIPGLMNNEELWSKIKPQLEKSFELIHIPIPNSDDFEEAIKELDKSFDEEKINLVGFSLGAYLASYYISKRANRIKKAFLISGTPSSLKKAENERRELLLKQLDNLKFKSLSLLIIKAHLNKENKENSELINLIHRMFLSFSLDEYKIQLRSTFNRVDLHNELISSNIPIKLLYSKGDKLLNQNSIKKMREKASKIEMLVMEGRSHMLPLEEPEIVAKEIKEWFSFI